MPEGLLPPGWLYWLHRASEYVLLNLLEDPAYLALVFC